MLYKKTRKKLADLTIGELIDICNFYNDCSNCLFSKTLCLDGVNSGIAQALCICEENSNMIVEVLDKKKKVKKKKITIKDRLKAI